MDDTISLVIIYSYLLLALVEVKSYQLIHLAAVVIFSKYFQNLLGMYDLHGICLIHLTQEAVKCLLSHYFFCMTKEYRRVSIFCASRVGILRIYIPRCIQITMIKCLQLIFSIRSSDSLTALV